MTPGDGYHHGDLPRALKDATAELVAERGPAGFSLREVARRAGVSHAAPSHHFGDATGLLTAVAVEGFQALAAALAQARAANPDPVECLAAQGRAYVELSISHPGHCAVLSRSDLVDSHSPDYAEAGDRAYGELEQTVRDIADLHNPELDVSLASRLCWSAMQGLVELYDTMRLKAQLHDEPTIPDIAEMADRFSRLMAKGFINRTG